MGTEEPTNLAASLPQYKEMISATIEALGEKNGSSKAAISAFMESTYGGKLPAAHSALLAHHLDKMKEGGYLVQLDNGNYEKLDNGNCEKLDNGNYEKPARDPNPPMTKRGRGRPPKPKVPLPPGASPALGSPRPRGRPPKVRDPFAPPPPKKMKAASTGSGRPRGRPPKKDKVVGSPSPASGAPRPRGRPPKAVAAVGC